VERGISPAALATRQSSARTALLAAGGAFAISVLAVVISVVFLRWRSKEQLRVLDMRRQRCERGEAEACDQLRSACLKRSGEACFALAGALLAQGPRRDVREGARLLGDACTYRHVEACHRAGTLLLEGTLVPKNEAEGRALLARACELGMTQDCGK